MPTVSVESFRYGFDASLCPFHSGISGPLEPASAVSQEQTHIYFGSLLWLLRLTKKLYPEGIRKIYPEEKHGAKVGGISGTGAGAKFAMYHDASKKKKEKRKKTKRNEGKT